LVDMELVDRVDLVSSCHVQSSYGRLRPCLKLPSRRSAYSSFGPAGGLPCPNPATKPAERRTLSTPAANPTSRKTMSPQGEVPATRSTIQPIPMPTTTPAMNSLDSLNA